MSNLEKRSAELNERVRAIHVSQFLGKDRIDPHGNHIGAIILSFSDKLHYTQIQTLENSLKQLAALDRVTSRDRSVECAILDPNKDAFDAAREILELLLDRDLINQEEAQKAYKALELKPTKHTSDNTQTPLNFSR